MAATATKNTTLIGGSYTNQNLEDLQKRVDEANQNLKKYNTDAAKDEELRARAQSEYDPTYNAQRGQHEAAKNTAKAAYDTAMGAYERQYNRDAEALGRSYDSQAVAANNNMLARGFNNSSLAVAMQNHVNTQRNRALQELQLERQAGESAAQAQYNNAMTAADAALAQLEVDRQSNIDARYQALKEQDQQRVNQATAAQNDLTQYITNLMLQIESLRQQGYSQYLAEQEAANQLALQQAAQEQARREYEDQFKLQQAQFKLQQDQAAHGQKIADAEMLLAQKEFDARYGGATGGGTGGSSGSASGKKTGNETTVPTAVPEASSSLADQYNKGSKGDAVQKAQKAIQTGATVGVTERLAAAKQRAEENARLAAALKSTGAYARLYAPRGTKK